MGRVSFLLALIIGLTLFVSPVNSGIRILSCIFKFKKG